MGAAVKITNPSHAVVPIYRRADLTAASRGGVAPAPRTGLSTRGSNYRWRDEVRRETSDVPPRRPRTVQTVRHGDTDRGSGRRLRCEPVNTVDMAMTGAMRASF